MQTERERNEIIRQEVVSDSANYSNPMPKMWKCIVINILSQVIGLARTIYYVADPAMDCKFTSFFPYAGTRRLPKSAFSSCSW
jgi:hypothetical protein